MITTLVKAEGSGADHLLATATLLALNVELGAIEIGFPDPGKIACEIGKIQNLRRCIKFEMG